MADEMIISDKASVDIDMDFLVPAREVLRRANEGNEFAENTLCGIISMIAMLVNRAKHGEDDAIVEKLMRFTAECSRPTFQ